MGPFRNDTGMWIKVGTTCLYFALMCPIVDTITLGRYHLPIWQEHNKYTKVIQKVSTVRAYISRILETVPLHMCSDFLYQLRSHRCNFVKFMLCLCLFLCVKHVWDKLRGRRLWNTAFISFFESQECATKWDSSPDLSGVWWQCDEWWHC